MSVDTTMAVLYAQSGLSNAANVAMVAPQASLAMTRVLAAEQQDFKRRANDDQDEEQGFIHTLTLSRLPIMGVVGSCSSLERRARWRLWKKPLRPSWSD